MQINNFTKLPPKQLVNMSVTCNSFVIQIFKYSYDKYVQKVKQSLYTSEQSIRAPRGWGSQNFQTKENEVGNVLSSSTKFHVHIWSDA
jgi:hypothetical protein